MTDRMREMQLRQLNEQLEGSLKEKSEETMGGGWIRRIRKILGITLEQLADRIGVNHSTVHEYEQREEKGTITLKTLRKVADALQCDFVYAFVPRMGDFEDLRERQARLAAEKVVEGTSRSMELEDQAVTEVEKEEQIEDLKDEFLSNWDSSIWDFETE